MRRHEALALLGLSEQFGPGDLRDAYRRAARRLHPDRPGAPADATEQMVSINLAHALLLEPSTAADPSAADLSAADPPPWSRPVPGRTAGVGGVAVELFDDGSLLVDAPAEETFERLLEAVDTLGDPTYVDVDAGLLQIIVSHADGPFCYLTFSLQGRAGGTEIFTTIERLDSVATLDPWPLLAALADNLRGG